jgi:hypothetical protein
MRLALHLGALSDTYECPAAERAEAFATFLAYAGRYAVEANKVIHHVEVASVQNWVNTDLVCPFAIQGNQLTLRNPSTSLAGQIQTFDLVWERLR